MSTMPYNTRRKSLSLPSLGIHLPNGSRAHRSNSKSSSPPQDAPVPPAKRVKRSHAGPLSPSTSPDPETRNAVQHTPPPSPRRTPPRRLVDTRGINDDIVVAVIEQLEKTGNRPHLIKDLAAILASTNDNIAHSANPAALLSSRLTTYLKREWTPLSPCPLAKELVPVHPRKVFFYLTTQSRQSLPDHSDNLPVPDIKRLTPSISDPSVEDIEHDRGRMSPSPEVELYSPELENGSPAPLTPGESFSSRNVSSPDHVPEVKRGHRPHYRAPSPPLEADERGFTETATAVRARGMSLREPIALPNIDEDRREEMSVEMRQKRDHEELFGQLHGHGLQVDTKMLTGSSPMIAAAKGSWQQRGAYMEPLHLDDVEMGVASWSLLSPETIEVDELDMMFEEY